MILDSPRQVHCGFVDGEFWRILEERDGTRWAVQGDAQACAPPYRSDSALYRAIWAHLP